MRNLKKSWKRLTKRLKKLSTKQEMRWWKVKNHIFFESDLYGNFLRGYEIFDSHSKAFFKHPNDCTNNPELFIIFSKTLITTHKVFIFIFNNFWRFWYDIETRWSMALYVFFMLGLLPTSLLYFHDLKCFGKRIIFLQKNARAKMNTDPLFWKLWKFTWHEFNLFAS